MFDGDNGDNYEEATIIDNAPEDDSANPQRASGPPTAAHYC
jgi:hypothetical protein